MGGLTVSSARKAIFIVNLLQWNYDGNQKMPACGAKFSVLVQRKRQLLYAVAHTSGGGYIYSRSIGVFAVLPTYHQVASSWTQEVFKYTDPGV